MKNYFDFIFSGKKFFPYWIVYFVTIVATVAVFATWVKTSSMHTAPSMAFLLVTVVFLLTLLFYYVYLKMVINATSLKNEKFIFQGEFDTFLLKGLGGLLLTIITLGIYYPWFKATMSRYFVDNTHYKDQHLEFKSTGLTLFLITLIAGLPIFIVLFFVQFLLNIGGSPQPVWSTGFVQLLTYFLMIPFMYCIYKWFFNINYDTLNIHWETKFWPSVGTIALQLLLTFITFGIYFPMMYIKVYHYFAGKTVAESEQKKYNFGYDIDSMNDFLFFWGQMLLFVITLGIYYPWMLQKLGRRFIGKTYAEEVYNNEVVDVEPQVVTEANTESPEAEV